MPRIDDLVPTKSQFLTKDDVGLGGVDLQIKGFVERDVGLGDELERKYTVEWTDGNYKPMVLNKENASRLKMALRTDDTDQMLGGVVNVYNDPNVAFGGKVVGGIRIRPAKATAQAPARKPRPPVKPSKPYEPEPEDDGAPTPPVEAYDDEPPWKE